MNGVNDLSEERIRELLAARQADPYISPMRETNSDEEATPAAVLIPMLKINEQWNLLYILRTVKDTDRHSGQVAYPGGRLDGDESAEEGALREAYEEVGLDREDVRMLGKLEDFITISNYSVTPVVGVIPWPRELKPQPEEVQRIFTVPLAWLADPANREERERIAPNGETLKVVYFTEYDRELVWGVTARITLNFLQALGLA
jgi:8-oxo-dGTP pyrophosphatase MutT (NUDIX family)